MANKLARINDTGIEINNTHDLALAVRMIVESDLCPKQYKGKPKDAMIAILAGRAVGWGPIQSLCNIAVVNGRPSMYGEGPSSLAYASGKVEWIREWWELDGKPLEAAPPIYATLADYPNSLTACWQAKRGDASEPTPVKRFSVADAKAARLWEKRGQTGQPTPWIHYPKRMLVFRARSWGLRDHFADALQGISQAEEWEDVRPAKSLDPLEERAKAKHVEATVIEPLAEPPPAEPATITTADKLELVEAVKAHIAAAKVAQPLDAVEMIRAAIQQQLGKDTIDTREELDAVRAAILAGQYDLETGDRIPDMGDAT